MQRDIRCRLLLVCASLVGHIAKLGRLFGYKHAFGRVIHEDNSRNQESDIYVQNVLKSESLTTCQQNIPNCLLQGTFTM